MQAFSHLPQEVQEAGSTLIPPFILMALCGHDLAHMPQEVQSSARMSALTAFSNILSALCASAAVTDTCPPPNNRARPYFVLTRAISNSGEYFTSPTVLRESST